VPAVPDPAAPVRRVLVVDDEPAIRELLAMVCAYEGWDVTTAATGEAALGAVRADPPDVVLLDRMLPDLDGLAVLRGIRDSSPAVPVIMVTARDSAEDRAALLAAGATGYVTKPFGVAALADEIRRAFGQVAATTPVPRRTASTTPASTR
jgi:two-component system OmpR family response regulator